MKKGIPQHANSKASPTLKTIAHTAVRGALNLRNQLSQAIVGGAAVRQSGHETRRRWATRNTDGLHEILQTPQTTQTDHKSVPSTRGGKAWGGRRLAVFTGLRPEEIYWNMLDKIKTCARPCGFCLEMQRRSGPDCPERHTQPSHDIYTHRASDTIARCSRARTTLRHPMFAQLIPPSRPPSKSAESATTQNYAHGEATNTPAP